MTIVTSEETMREEFKQYIAKKQQECEEHITQCKAELKELTRFKEHLETKKHHKEFTARAYKDFKSLNGNTPYFSKQVGHMSSTLNIYYSHEKCKCDFTKIYLRNLSISGVIDSIDEYIERLNYAIKDICDCTKYNPILESLSDFSNNEIEFVGNMLKYIYLR